MRILMITPYLPYPLHSGGQIRSYNLIKNLSAEHEIILLSFMKQVVPEYISEMKKYCSKVHVISRRKAFSLQNILLAGLTPYPFLVTIYLSQSLKKKIKETLAQKRYDLIHAETFYVMPNIPKTAVPILLVEQTIEYLVYAHFVNSFRNPFLKPLLAIDVSKIKFWESFYWRKADKVVAMSNADRAKMLSQVANLSCEIIPNGIDAQFFAQVRRPRDKVKTVVFVGNFSWLQNREAVDFLVDKIWPRIKRQIRDVKLLIVGMNPTHKIIELGGKNDITIDANVTDIRETYASASVLLAPIFGPGGTRFKILEAMSSGVPVVTTQTGIEGIPAQDGQHVLMGETTDQLAALTVKILQDEKLAQNLAENAKILVQTQFSWEKISDQLNKLYAKVANIKN